MSAVAGVATTPPPPSSSDPTTTATTTTTTPKPGNSRTADNDDVEDDEEEEDPKTALPLLSESLVLDNLWETLSACLLELEHTPDHHAVLVLQPAVEAFFLVHSSSSTSARDRDRNNDAGIADNNVDVVADIAPVSPIFAEVAAAAAAEAAAAAAPAQPAAATAAAGGEGEEAAAAPAAAPVAAAPPTAAVVAAAAAAIAPHSWDANPAATQKQLPPDQLKFLKFAGELSFLFVLTRKN